MVLGDGDKIINQYPLEGNVLNEGDLVVLLTNNYDKKMIDFTGLSYKDALNILKLMGVKYHIEGNGYVYEQNILSDSVIDDNSIVELKLMHKFENTYEE